MAGKAGGVALGLVSNALLARILTPDELGSYFLFLSIVTVAAVVAQLGLNQAIVRIVAESRAVDLPGRARLSISFGFKTVLVSALFLASLLHAGLGAWIAGEIFSSEICPLC